MYKHILIPTDGSELSDKAIDQGTELARSTGARVTYLTVTRPFHLLASEPMRVSDTAQTYAEDVERVARMRLAACEDVAKARGVVAGGEHVSSDQPYRAIIESAGRNGCDLVFMASHGRSGLAALVIGSETQKVLTHSKLPVLVCR